MNAVPRARRRILVIPAWYPSETRPQIGTFVREHVRALVRAGHEVTVVARDPAPASDGLIGQFRSRSEDGALVVRFRIRGAQVPVISTLTAEAAMQTALLRLRARGFQPEVVHAHVVSAAALALPVARVLRSPLVVTEHYSGFPRGLMSRRELAIARRTLAAADLVAPVSRNLQSHMEAAGVRARFEVVPNVVDTAVFRPGPRAVGGNTPPLLLLVGGLTPVKGIPHAIRAVGALDRPVELEIVGDGPCRREYEALTRTLGLSDRVRFSGAQSREQVASLMRAADLYVLSSEWENLPTVVLEALSSGLPVVAADVGGVSEAVSPGDGLLVAPKPAALADGIERALDARWDRREIACRAAARFGASAVVARWEKIYAGLIASRA
jgi:glycosyltransferase involved in cell wall biosynthesis